MKPHEATTELLIQGILFNDILNKNDNEESREMTKKILLFELMGRFEGKFNSDDELVNHIAELIKEEKTIDLINGLKEILELSRKMDFIYK